MCHLMALMNPQQGEMYGCGPETTTTATPQTTTTAPRAPVTQNPAQNIPKTTQNTPIVTPIQINTQPLLTTSTPNPVPSIHGPQIPVSDEDLLDSILQDILDLPIWSKIMASLAILYILLSLVSCCSEGMAKIIRNISPGNHQGCLGCLDRTAHYADIAMLLVRAVQGILVSLMNRFGRRSEQHETRDIQDLLPGPRSNREEGTMNSMV